MKNEIARKYLKTFSIGERIKDEGGNMYSSIGRKCKIPDSLKL
jgi:hypothetical protein